MIGSFRRLVAYEQWAGGLTLASIERAREHLEKDRDVGASSVAPFVRALQVHAHVQAARRLWLSRIEHGPLPDNRCPSDADPIDPPSDGLFPSWSIERVREEHAAMDAAWSRLSARTAGDDLARVVRYTTTEGDRTSSTLVDIVTHVVNHASYHRGQISRLLAECGIDPAPTDFILFARAHH